VNVSVTCNGRSLCGCLDAADTCSWCQYSQNFTDSTGDSYTASMGRCMMNSIADKCTGEISSGGYRGNLIRVKPADCTSNSISPNVVDPSTHCSDKQISNIIKQVSDGSFTALGFQRILNQLNVKNIIIRDISPPCTDGNNGQISFTFDNYDGLTTDQVMENLIQALSTNFNVYREQISIQIFASSSTEKRQLDSSSTSLAITSISAFNGSSPSVNPSPSTGPAPAVNPSPSVDQQPASNDTDPTTGNPQADNTNPAPYIDQQPASNDTDTHPTTGKPPPSPGDENATPYSAAVHISPVWFLSMFLVIYWM